MNKVTSGLFGGQGVMATLTRLTSVLKGKNRELVPGTESTDLAQLEKSTKSLAFCWFQGFSDVGELEPSGVGGRVGMALVGMVGLCEGIAVGDGEGLGQSAREATQVLLEARTGLLVGHMHPGQHG